MAMTTEEKPTDAKAGYCTHCRQGSHSLCASSSCTCPDARRHRGRPTFGRPGAAPTPLRSVNGRSDPPGLVWEEPPPKHHGGGLLARMEPMLKALHDNPGEWARIGEYKSKSGAGTAARSLRKAMPKFEFEARITDTASRLYGRFKG